MGGRVTVAAAAVLLAAALGAAGCGGDEGAALSAATFGTPGGTATAPAPTDGGAAGIMLAGSGLSVAEALADAPQDGTPVVVRAYVIVQPDGSARLCDALAESSPPQCGGASMVLTNLPEGFLTGLKEAQGVHWTDLPAQLIGRIQDDVFVNDPELLVAG